MAKFEKIELLLRSDQQQNIDLAIQLLRSVYQFDEADLLRYIHQFHFGDGDFQRYSFEILGLSVYAGLKAAVGPLYDELGFGEVYAFMQISTPSMYDIFDEYKLVEEEVMVDDIDLFPRCSTYQDLLFNYFEAAIPVILKYGGTF